MGTITYTRYLSPEFLHLLAQQRMNGLEFVQAKMATAETRLVGGDGNPVTPPGQRADGLQASGNRLPVRDAADVVIGVLVDNTVAIQDDQGHGLFADSQLRYVRDLQEQIAQFLQQV